MHCRTPEDAQNLGSVWPRWARALAMIGLKFVDAESLKKYIHVAMQIASCCYVCYFFLLPSLLFVRNDWNNNERKRPHGQPNKRRSFTMRYLAQVGIQKAVIWWIWCSSTQRGQGLVGFSFGISPSVNARPVWDVSRPTTSPRVGRLAREMRHSQMEHDGIGKIEVWSLQDNFLNLYCGGF